MLDIKWVPANATNYAMRPKGSKPEIIVIHVMAGTLAGTDAWFQNPKAKVSAHYGVSATAIHQYVKEEDRAYHAGVVTNPSAKIVLARPGENPNSYSIGIEHEGSAETPWSPELYAQSARLVADVAKRWNIPLDRDHVIGHHEIYAVKPCPGQCDLARLVKEAAALVTT